MLETAAFLSFYLAFALAHGADRKRFPLQRWKPPRALSRTMRLAAALAATGGVALWGAADGLASALLVAPAALGVVATAFVLLAPLAPRVVWTTALACPALIVSLALSACSASGTTG